MYNILIFGDSIAAGRKVKKESSWAGRLTEFFDEKDKDFTLVHNLSVPGHSTTEVVERFHIEAKARCEKVYPDDHCSIIFAAGINDIKSIGSKNNLSTDKKEFKSNLKTLIKNSKKYTDHIAFIGLTPVNEQKAAPIGDTYFLNKNIKKYNKIIKDVCKENDIKFLEISRRWLETNYLRLLADDGVHPNKKGHQKIFEATKKFFK